MVTADRARKTPAAVLAAEGRGERVDDQETVDRMRFIILLTLKPPHHMYFSSKSIFFTKKLLRCLLELLL